MKSPEFVGLAVVSCGIAVLVGSVIALLEYRERESLARELEQLQRQEWIESLIEMRREEMTNQIKYKPS